MLLNGQTLECIEPFFIFKKGYRYYCSHVDEKHFFLVNNETEFNVNCFKIPFNHAKKFKIIF